MHSFKVGQLKKIKLYLINIETYLWEVTMETVMINVYSSKLPMTPLKNSLVDCKLHILKYE